MTEVKTALISEDRLYRYRLTREWGTGRLACFIMLNPSTADAFEDDATIRRCRSFAMRENCQGFQVVNLFGWRATNPRELREVGDPEGPGNLGAVRLSVDVARQRGAPVIVGWGGDQIAISPARRLLSWVGPVQCLGVTKSGAPKHPLYLEKGSPLEPFVIQSPDLASGETHGRH